MARVKVRIFIIGSFMLLASLAVVFQAFRLQFLDVFSKSKGLKKVIIPCKRGFIYDRHGEPLAISTQVPSLYACPNVIKNPQRVAYLVSKVLHLQRQGVLKRLEHQGEFVWIKRWLSKKEAQDIAKLDIEGLNFRLENKRSYPHGHLAGQVLGFVGIDNHGLEGIEKRFDAQLEGRPGFYYGIKDARGRIILAPRAPINPAQDGSDVYLSIDTHIQYATEQALEKAVKKWHAKRGYAIVVIPQTGEIVAMANYPFFNPNKFRFSSPKIWRNRSITDVFEPGSTFKSFLLATALDKRIWSPNDIVFAENGKFHFENVVFHDVEPHAWLSVANVIVYSSNIGAVKIGLKVGKENFYQYIKKFGFGEKTGIDLLGESPGLVRPVSQWTDVDMASACFGQGLGVTAIQLAMAYSAIANGGFLMKPLIVKKIVDPDGRVLKVFQPQIKRKVIGIKVAQQVRKILRKVVIKGTGTEAEIPGYEIAGKTGTSQKINPLTGQYSHKFVASFAGFFPASQPRVVIVVVIDEPHPVYYGGIVAAPAFKEIAQHIIWQWQIPPSAPNELRLAQKKDVVRLSNSNSEKEIITKASVVVGKGIMPNLKGLSLRAALKILQRMKLRVKIKGSGEVIGQQPPAGSKVLPQTTCILKLGDNG